MQWRRMVNNVKCILAIHRIWPFSLDSCRTLTRTRIGKWPRRWPEWLYKNKRCWKRIGNTRVKHSTSFVAVTRSLAEKLNKLQQALDERKIAFNAISTKNTLLEADLTVARQEHDDLQNQLKKMDIDKDEQIHRIQRDCKREKDVRQSTRMNPNLSTLSVGIDRHSRKTATGFEWKYGDTPTARRENPRSRTEERKSPDDDSWTPRNGPLERGADGEKHLFCSLSRSLPMVGVISWNWHLPTRKINDWNRNTKKTWKIKNWVPTARYNVWKMRISPVNRHWKNKSAS